jgi:malonate decarboxylase delta subunit
MSTTTERLRFEFDGGVPTTAFAPTLVGVVGSGNLEVLMEPATGLSCSVEIETSTRGFGHIWQAVLRDFHERHPLAGVRVSIHDMGATPAVVGLRLDQAFAQIAERRP